MSGTGRCRMCGARMPPDDLADHVSMHTMREGAGSLQVTPDAGAPFDVIAIVRMHNRATVGAAKAYLHGVWNAALCGAGRRRANPTLAPATGRAMPGCPAPCRLRMVIVKDYEPAPPWAAGGAPVQVLAFGISGAAARMLG